MAHVDSRACVDATQIEAYYVRAGALLAILYALRGADVHCENLIAAGPYPTVIDAEVLLMPHHRARAPIVNAQEKARLRLNASVAATGTPATLADFHDGKCLRYCRTRRIGRSTRPDGACGLDGLGQARHRAPAE